jgi:hypothetical protein
MSAKRTSTKKANISLLDKNAAEQNSSRSKASLECRDDCLHEWIICSWFKENSKNKALKIVFLELFMSLYDDLSEKFTGKKRDEIFKNFINVIFPTVLDVYKWHKSEKENQDIGLLRALEEIPSCEWYIDLLASYSKYYYS